MRLGMNSRLLGISVVLLCLVIGGCGDSPNGGGGAVALKLNIALETPSLASQIAVVTLTIRYGTVPVGPDTLNYADGVVSDTVSVVPGDSITFILRAISANDVVLYEGREGPRTVQPGSTLPLSILLRPAVLMLRAAPLIQEIEFPGQQLIEVFVDVYNVDSLFGAAFRAHYDTTILEFDSAIEGNFLKGSGSSSAPTLALVVKDSAEFVAYSVTRLRQSSVQDRGVGTDTAPGRLATLRFKKKRVGTSAITFEPTAQLVNPNGILVRNHDSLVLESATVRIIPN
jgi:hypothetical protein